MFSCYPQPRLIIAILIADLSVISGAQTANSCISNQPTTANATSSIGIAGFQPFIDTPLVQNSTWTISTAIDEVQDFESNNYIIEQSFWLDAQPPITTSAADLPYTGCAVLLTGFSSPRISTGTNSTNSCDGVFDTACYNAIVGAVQTFILEEAPGSIENVCQTMTALETPPSLCENYAWTATTATQPFGNPSFLNTINDTCSGNIFNGTLNLISQTSATTSPLSNYTTYDAWAKQATPLFLMAFTKNITNQTPRWGATSLMCLTADHFSPGSRVVATSGAGQTLGTDCWVFGLGIWGLIITLQVLW